MPTCVSQQRSNPTIAVSAILPGQYDHICYKTLFVRTPYGHFALRGSMLSQNAASAAFRDFQFIANTINARATTSGA